MTDKYYETYMQILVILATILFIVFLYYWVGYTDCIQISETGEFVKWEEGFSVYRYTTRNVCLVPIVAHFRMIEENK